MKLENLVETPQN